MSGFDCTKEYRLPVDEIFKPIRNQRYPVQYNGCQKDFEFSIDDQLETKGMISLYRGRLFTAQIEVMVSPEKKEIHISRIIYESGQESLVYIIWEQVVTFARFYDCAVSISKNPQISITDKAE